MSNLKVDYSQIIELQKRMELLKRIMPEHLEDWLHNVVGPDLKEEMQRRAPSRTGNLRNKIEQINGPMSVRVGPMGVSYLVYVVEGTKPHEIRPKNAGGVLAFKIGNRTIFARSVRHPGTKPNTFMEDSARVVIRRSLPRLYSLKTRLEKTSA